MNSRERTAEKRHYAASMCLRLCNRPEMIIIFHVMPNLGSIKNILICRRETTRPVGPQDDDGWNSSWSPPFMPDVDICNIPDVRKIHVKRGKRIAIERTYNHVCWFCALPRIRRAYFSVQSLSVPLSYSRKG